MVDAYKRLTRLGCCTMMAVLKARRAFLFTSDFYVTAMNTLTTYLKHVRAEFVHIVWPTRRKATGHTLVVIFIAVLITIIVGVLDYLFGGIVSSVVGA